MNEEIEKQIVDELRSLNAFARKASKTNRMALVMLGVLVAAIIVSIPLRHRLNSRARSASQTTDSWQQARTLLDQGATDKGREMIERLLQKNPDYFYGHALMGSVYQELGDLDAAEKSYARAADLFPNDDNEKTLTAIRKAIQRRNETANKILVETQ